MQNIIALFVFVVLCFGAAAFGAQFTPGPWYEGLNKPSWNPPNWIFGPVWTVLYLLMAVSGWLIWRQRESHAVGAALAVFVLQLLLNAAWSWIFFGLHRPGLALVEIVALGLTILATVLLFWRIQPLAGALLLPYLAWVSFATVLNGAIWRLNP